MEEILELKELLLKGDIKGSLTLIDELEEMGRKDIINNIRSYAVILLLHLIKQQAENRTTRSWDVSIRNSVLEIKDLNERPKSKGVYLNSEELQVILEKAYPQAINKASLEVQEGRYDSRELEQLVNRVEILSQAMSLIDADTIN
jgi:Zn-finger nucleic acid-binding protein